MTTSNKAAEVTADQVAAKLIETAPLIMYFLRNNARRDKESNSSIARLRAMAFLQNCPNSSLSQVSGALGITNATASSLIDGLVHAGLVERKGNPSTRRQILLKLTEPGERQLQATRRLRTSEIAALLSDLPFDQLEKVQEGLSILKESFQHASSPQ